jgi:unsaturated rhamnogalacturonyl hydrolase
MTNSEKLEKAKALLLGMQRHSWEQGVAAQAFFECGDSATGILLAREAAHRQAPDGRLALMDAGDSLDPGANGGPVLAAYALTGEEVFRRAAEGMAGWFLQRAPRAADGTLYHTTTGAWTLVDGIYHLAPFLAQAGCPQEAVKQIQAVHRIHYLPEKRLYAHCWDEEKGAFRRAACWGGAQGWMAGALARTIAYLPADMGAEKELLSAYLRQLLDGCLAHQRADGLFHDVIDDPATFVETTAALMLAYAIYRAVGGGTLARGYLSAADRMRAAAWAQVDELGCVQGAAGAPSFDFPGFSAESQAFLILMEAAFNDLQTAL